jgi:chromosome segregation ATPase
VSENPTQDVLPSGSMRRGTRITNLHGVDVDVAAVLRPEARLCGYSKCGNELDYDGKGRPPEYCPPAVRTWPGGKTCKQMAHAERDAVRVAGLDAQLDAFDASTGRLIAAAGPLHERLGDLLADVAAVRSGALVRVGEAEREMAAALDRAEQAERAATQARHDEVQARAAAETAAAAAAGGLQRAARIKDEADTRIAAALDRLSIVEREHGQALGRAHAAEAARHDEARRRADAEQRTADLEAQLHQARETIERARGAQDALHARADAAEQAAHRVQADLEHAAIRAQQAETLAAAQAAELSELRARITGERATAETRATAAQTLAEAQADQEELRRQIAGAAATARAATERAERAETRHDQLVATLSTLAHRSATPEGDPA